MFEAGVSTFIFEDRPLSVNELRQIKEAGFDLIEVWGRKPHFDFSSQVAIREVVASIKSLKMRVVSLHGPFGEGYDLSNPDREIRQRAVREIINTLNILDDLGGDKLVVHGGIRIKEGGNRKSYLFNMRKSVEEILKVCDKKKKILALENMLPGIVCDSADEVWEIVNSFTSVYIGICLDTGHAHIAGDLVQAAKKFQSRLLTLHISDNSGTSDQHLLPGEGNINWSVFLSTLAQGSYDGPFIYELIKREDNISILKQARSIYEKFRTLFMKNLV